MKGLRRRSWKLLSLVLSGTLVLMAIVVAGYARDAIHRAQTTNRLQHIRMALEGYRHRNGCYPPQYLADQRGRPAHSWRVLLLPFLGYEDLYQRYRFEEPWNGPHNRLLATEMPEEYRSPFLDSKSTITQYVGIAGKDTFWQGATPVCDSDLLEDPSHPHICVVEAANSDINWMDPRDIPIDKAVLGISAPNAPGIQSNYSDGLPAQMLPYGQQWIPLNTSTATFRAMLTVTDGKNKTASYKKDAKRKVRGWPGLLVNPGDGVARGNIRK